MKNRLMQTLLLSAGLSLAFPVFAADMGNMDMKGMSGMAGSPAVDKTAHGTGVIKNIDTKQGTVTLAHQAIKSLNWPAMTMAFKVADIKLLKGFKSGDKVSFDLKGSGMAQVVTAIAPAN